MENTTDGTGGSGGWNIAPRSVVEAHLRLVGVAELCSPLLVLLHLSVRWGRGVTGATL